MAASLLALIEGRAAAAPDQPAILAPDRRPATYADLHAQVMAVGTFLDGVRIDRDAVVALALPNGPDLAVAFLGTAAAAACAPLAPDRPVAEHRRDLERLGARACIVSRGSPTAARDAAGELGIPIVELDARDAAGTFTLEQATPRADAGPGPSRAGTGDAALLLFTSGTTSAPKLVPLTGAGLLASASTVAATLGLGPDDRCLNVMPLFHIHGLVAALLASISTGGSVVCTPGFRAGEVWQWLDDLRPTWYTAVPTIHQAMLDTVRRRVDAGEPTTSTLRFVRSSSAALPARVMADLETALGVPVIEAYGMTEAAHQIASNPLPPALRVAGTVGRATGTEITVRDDAGHPVPTGDVGEVVIRGPALATHYIDAPEATDAAFTADGWFRTGDQGVLDDAGYLTLTGRLKELVNRGGEKVAPREVDDALLEHPHVEYAVAFGVPHPRLGEEVAAAVVLYPGATVTGPQLRVHVAERLAPYKVPRRVVVVDEIPRGATGKLDRLGLAARLGLADGFSSTDAQPVEPADATERALAEVWQEVLGSDVLPSVTVDFFELGGDSLHANELLEEIETTFGRRLPATVFFTSPTVRTMADHLRGDGATTEPSVVPIQPYGSRPPLFCLMRAGSVVTLRHLARTLGPDQPVYGLWMPAMHTTRDEGGSIEEIAAACVELIRATQPDGPVFLFGHSMGGMVMYETARQLDALGRRVGLLVIADAVNPEHLRTRWEARHNTRYRLRKLFSRRGPAVVAWRVKRIFRRPAPKPVELLPGTEVVVDWDAAMERERRYVAGPAVGPVVVLATSHYTSWAGSPDLGWAAVVPNGVTCIEVPGSHDTMIGEPHVHVLAARVDEVLRRAQADCGVDEVSAG